MRVFDLAAAATVVDIGRHQAKINFGHTATRPRRHVVFLDKPLNRSEIFLAALFSVKLRKADFLRW